MSRLVVATDEYVRMPLTQLAVGGSTRFPVRHEQEGDTFIDADTAIDHEVVQSLAARGITEVWVHPDDANDWDHLKTAKVRLSFEGCRVNEAPRAIYDYVSRILRRQARHRGHEQRRWPRFPCSHPVLAMPIHDNLTAAGEPFQGVARDLSCGGMAFYSTRAVHHKLLALEIGRAPGAVLRMVLHVTRCQFAGRFYEIAGRFVARIEG